MKRYFGICALLLLVGFSFADEKTLEEELSLLKAENKMLKTSNDAKTKQLRELKTKIRKQSDEIQQLNKKIADFEFRLLKLNKTIKALQIKNMPTKKKGSDKTKKSTHELKQQDQEFARLKKILYEKYKHKYVYVAGKFYKLPEFDLRFKNSRKGIKLPKEYEYKNWHSAKSKKQEKLKLHSPDYMKKRREYWSNDLPRIDVGEFGLLTEPIEIIQIHDKWSAFVEISKKFTWIPYYGKREETVKMIGFPTEDLVDGDIIPYVRKAPLHVAIIGTHKYTDALGTARTVYLAIPMPWIRRGLSEDQFDGLLKTKLKLYKELEDFRK